MAVDVWPRMREMVLRLAPALKAEEPSVFRDDVDTPSCPLDDRLA
jgi:hypothetical protein